MYLSNFISYVFPIYSSLIFFSLLTFRNCAISFDEMIMASKVEYGSNIKQKKTYQIRQFLDRNYFKVISFYGKVEILNPDERVISTLQGGEKEFNFQYERDYYYLIFTPPTPLVDCGFQVMSRNIEYTNILTSTMKLQFVKERDFNIEIKNEKSETKLISLGIYTSSSVSTGFRSASGVENGKNFPIKSVYT